jgi:hypothetical protein
MKFGPDRILLSAAILLAAVTATLSFNPVRRDVDEYFSADRTSRTWETTALVVRSSMSEDAAHGSNPMDWRLTAGD